MSVTELLQENHTKLLEEYSVNLEDVLALQDTLIDEVLPSVAGELSLTPEVKTWAKEWLEDTATIFRIYRRCDFTKSVALESIRKNLLWRVNDLWQSDRSLPIPTMRCLPGSAQDPFGRPILVIYVPSDVIIDSAKTLIVRAFERSRAYLQHLNDTDSGTPIMQYIILLDLKGLSFSKIDMELVAWTLREVIPNFPGMVAGVFLLNFTWVHSSMWNFSKHVLPKSALSRVFFPSNQELMMCFTPTALPKDYGGDMQGLLELKNPLEMSHPRRRSRRLPPAEREKLKSQGRFPGFTLFAPTSPLNPFFGYPATSFEGSLSLQHGRRRKRDLARTLGLLFWVKWRKPVFFMGLFIAVCAVGLQMFKRLESLRPIESLRD